MKLLLSIVLLIALLQISARAADERVTPHWPQWRGPSATGVAPLGDPPLKWAEGMNVKWKVELPGAGTSTPVVWGDNVFVLTAIATTEKATPEKSAAQPAPAAAGSGASAPAAAQPSAPAPEGAPTAPGAAPANPPPADGRGRRRGGGGMRGEKPTQVHRFAVIALDRKTGKVRWEKTAREELPHEAHHRDHGFASFSPVTDGESLYVSFGSRGLFCFDFSGKLKWQNDLGNMQTKNAFGEGSSPALHGNALVVNWDHEGDDFIVALDKRTGKELWRQPRDESTSWSTPLIVEHEGKAQVVVSATRRIRAYDLETGKGLWECGGMTDNAIPTPVSAPGMVFVTSGFRGAALLAIKLGRTGDLTNTDAIVWRHDRGTPYVPSPLLYEDRLYFHSGNNGVVSCFHAPTGRPLFETQRLAELPGGVYASPVGAAGRVYLIGRDGNAAVIKHGDQLEVLASNKLDDRFDASPAIVGKEMFLRGHKHLYCIAEGAGSTAAR